MPLTAQDFSKADEWLTEWQIRRGEERYNWVLRDYDRKNPFFTIADILEHPFFGMTEHQMRRAVERGEFAEAYQRAPRAPIAIHRNGVIYYIYQMEKGAEERAGQTA